MLRSNFLDGRKYYLDRAGIQMKKYKRAADGEHNSGAPRGTDPDAISPMIAPDAAPHHEDQKKITRKYEILRNEQRATGWEKIIRRTAPPARARRAARARVARAARRRRRKKGIHRQNLGDFSIGRFFDCNPLFVLVSLKFHSTRGKRRR